jgi:hypothetical protein
VCPPNMGLWYRIFGRSSTAVTKTAVLECLHSLGAEGVFDGGETEWTQAVLTFGTAAPLDLERFLATDEGIRAELNSWAAFLETCEYNSNSVPLMEHMIQTNQLFTLRRPSDADGELVKRFCLGLCQLLARAADGVYQADDEGFFTADGVLLLPEQ